MEMDPLGPSKGVKDRSRPRLYQLALQLLHHSGAGRAMVIWGMVGQTPRGATRTVPPLPARAGSAYRSIRYVGLTLQGPPLAASIRLGRARVYRALTEIWCSLSSTDFRLYAGNGDGTCGGRPKTTMLFWAPSRLTPRPAAASRTSLRSQAPSASLTRLAAAREHRLMVYRWAGSDACSFLTTAHARCSSLRAAAQRATLIGFPAARKRW